MPKKIKGIENAKLVENIFGEWPSFHDAEIHSILLTRSGDTKPPHMDVVIHHWQLTGELDLKGYYVLKHHTLTTLRFFEIIELQLAGFNQQNVLWQLEISEPTESDSNFSVFMPSSYGCDAAFKCKRIKILSATPYSENVT